MQKQSEIEERILGLIMGIGIGTIIGFLLHASERRGNAGDRIRGTAYKHVDDRQPQRRLSVI